MMKLWDRRTTALMLLAAYMPLACSGFGMAVGRPWRELASPCYVGRLGPVVNCSCWPAQPSLRNNHGLGFF
jgi:hypothetical protein